MTRLSVKALRLHDEMGLLPPAHVDQSSGYPPEALMTWIEFPIGAETA